MLCKCFQVLQAGFRRIAAMMAQGGAAPIQALTFPFADVTAALRQFSHARHIGKIVVRLPPTAEPAACEQVLMFPRY
jgi:NADPH:quinone reductase-like Zn-dependent oxidoreductase